MRPTSTICFLLLGLATFPAPAGAQVGHATPERIVALAYRADSLHDWRTLLVLLHPDAVQEFHDSQVEWLRPDAFAALPGASADTCLTRAQEQHGRFMLDSVYGVPSIGALHRLPADSALARFYRHRNLDGEDASTRAPGGRMILGGLRANDTLAFVVVHEQYRKLANVDSKSEGAVTLTLRRWRGAWRLMESWFLPNASGFMLTTDCQ